MPCPRVAENLMRLLLFIALMLLIGVACTAASLFVATNTCCSHYGYGFPFIIYGSSCDNEGVLLHYEGECSAWWRPWAIPANIAFYSGLVCAIVVLGRLGLRRRAESGGENAEHIR